MRNLRDMTNMRFGEWRVEKELGEGKVVCVCSCGVKRELYKKALLEGRTRSCGHWRKKKFDIFNSKRRTSTSSKR